MYIDFCLCVQISTIDIFMWKFITVLFCEMLQ